MTSTPHKFVFIFEHGMPLGGVETSMLRLARGLARAGHEVKLLIHGGEVSVHPQLNDQVQSMNHGFLAGAGEEDVGSVARHYAAEGNAYVFPNQGPHAYPALRFAKKQLGADLRILGICHSDFPDYYELAEEYQDIVDVQFGVSQHICNELNKRLQKPSHLLILGVEVADVYPERPARKQLEILYTGRIENFGKRCSELIPAGERLRKRGIPFRMTIAGDGPYLEWIQKDRKKVPWWARRHYRIPGAVAPSDLVGLYRDADVYLSFTRFEGNSIAVMEAMAQGCIPVISRVSGTETVIEHERSGWLGEVDQPETLTRACETLWRNPMQRASMSREAWSRARQCCGIDQTVKAIEGCTRPFVIA